MVAVTIDSPYMTAEFPMTAVCGSQDPHKGRIPGTSPLGPPVPLLLPTPGLSHFKDRQLWDKEAAGLQQPTTNMEPRKASTSKAQGTWLATSFIFIYLFICLSFCLF